MISTQETLRAFEPTLQHSDRPECDFAKIAEAMGGDGVRVTTRAELARALTLAKQRRGKFQLVEVMVQRSVPENPLYTQNR